MVFVIEDNHILSDGTVSQAVLDQIFASRPDKLSFSSRRNLTSFSAPLPDSVKQILLTFCKNVISANFPSVEIIMILSCENLESLDLPTTLKELSISYCPNLQLPELSQFLELKKLAIRSTDRNFLLTTLSPKLEKLSLFNTPNCTLRLEKLPKKLTELSINGVMEPFSLPAKLPKKLKKLALEKNANIQFIPEELPNKITDLSFTYITQPFSLPAKLPKKLKELCLFESTGLQSLPAEFPKNLITLNLSNLTQFRSLETRLPTKLELLDLKGCSSLISLPALPAQIHSLFLQNCSSLISLPALPSSLVNLHLTGCANLKTISTPLPPVKSLNLSDCVNLEFTPELTENLALLERNGARIKYPEHFDRNPQIREVKEKLQKAIQSYHQESSKKDPNTPVPQLIKTLLHRFLNEGLMGRVDNDDNAEINSETVSKEIVKAVEPVVDILADNPDYIKWMEKIARLYLEGCVNQPVAGWAAICAMVNIAQAKGAKGEVKEKIEATKYLLTLEGIKEYIRKNSPGQSVEIEASNVLLREIHKKLLSEGLIKEPWLGVPEFIAYETTVASWATPDKIDDAYQNIKEALEQAPQEVANFLCSGTYWEFWSEIAFPEELARIKEECEIKLEILGDIIDEMEGSEEEILNQKNQEIIIKAFPNLGNKDNIRLDKLREIYNSFPSTADEIIREQITKLTEDSLGIHQNLSQEPGSSSKTTGHSQLRSKVIDPNNQGKS